MRAAAGRLHLFLFPPLFAALFCLPVEVTAQQMKAYMLAENSSVEDHVVELDVPPELNSSKFLIVWTADNGRSNAVWHVARPGKHSYEMRRNPEWRGHGIVMITLPGVHGRLKKPALSDEIDLFLETEPLLPSTINFLQGHTPFAWPGNAHLLIVAFIVAAGVAIRRRRPLVQSAVVGFVFAWAVMDLRSAYDHVVTAQWMERYQHRMLGFAEDIAFVRKSSEVIGSSTWSHGQLEWPMINFVRYGLAEHRYIPADSGHAPDFWISQDSREGQAILQFSNYYLLKKSRP